MSLVTVTEDHIPAASQQSKDPEHAVRRDSITQEAITPKNVCEYFIFTYGKTKQIVNLILFLFTDIQAHEKKPQKHLLVLQRLINKSAKVTHYLVITCYLLVNYITILNR